MRRLYYFRNFPDLPLIIIVAEAQQDIYAAWRQCAITIGSLMGSFALGFVGLSFLLGAQLRRRMLAESELELLAKTDGLTGLHNRRTLGEILEQEWRRARRARSMFSHLFVDIDQFEAYNDTYGHQAGDDALAAVARCVRDISGGRLTARRVTAARNSSSSFLADTSPAGASQIAEQIRSAISALAIEHAGSEYGRATASIGAASCLPDQHGDVSAVIRAADEALFSAKAKGRNRVRQFRPADMDGAANS